jgi:hypothetical protein
VNLSKNDLAMLGEMGSSFNEPELDNFIAAVQPRLESLEERGIPVTRNHIRAAATTELARRRFLRAEWLTAGSGVPCILYGAKRAPPLTNRRHTSGSPHGNQQKYTSDEEDSSQDRIAEHAHGHADRHERRTEENHNDRAKKPYH